MELHYVILTVVFVVLVIILGFVAVSMFLPLYTGGRESGLFNSTVTTCGGAGTACSTTISSTTAYTLTSTTTPAVFTSPPPGELRVRKYTIHDAGGTISIDITLENTYPVEVIVERIYLNDTLVYRGYAVIEPWSYVTRIAGDPKTAVMLVTIYGINTRINASSSSLIVVSGETIPVGNMTIFYRIPGVQGIYNTTFVLKLPKCMIRECPVFP